MSRKSMYIYLCSMSCMFVDENFFNRYDLLFCLLVYYLAKEVVITQPSTCCYEYLNT